MTSRIAKAALVLLFAGLLAAPIILTRYSESSGGSAEPLPHAEALERYGFYLEEVSSDVGVDFTHQAPALDQKLSHIMPQVASMGASVSAVDFDDDGWTDLYVTNSRRGSQNRLYRNQQDGTFRNVAAELGIGRVNQKGTGVSMGAVWGDYNNDGYEDVLLYKWGRPELYRNDEGNGFTRVTDKANLPDWVNANTAIWFDYNQDGLLDIFIAGYYPSDLNLWDIADTRIMTESFEYSNNGGRSYLLRNEGNGEFTEVAREVGIDDTRWTLAAAATDVTGNGYPDLFVANDYGTDQLYINKDGQRFVPSGEEAGMGFRPKSGMNAAFGDVFNRGNFAVYVSNISEQGVLVQGNNLWVPADSDVRDGNVPSYQNMAGALGVELGGWSYGAQFGDLNNDGNQDLYLANGYVSANQNASYWYDFSKVAGGNESIISDAKNWPAMRGRSLSGYQRNKIWINDGAGQFQDVGVAVGQTQAYDSRSIALADLWNRGTLDVVLANQRGPLLLYRNHVREGNRWIQFKLVGRESNRSAIGARVTVHWDGKMQTQQLFGGSGFSGQNQARLHFGLGPDPKVEKAVIQWPSGKEQTIQNPEVGKLHRIVEPAS